LIRQVFAANPKTVVVLISSYPYAINWTQEHVPAFSIWRKTARSSAPRWPTFVCDYNPAGRLVQTWPKSLDQVPPMMDYDIRHGRTYIIQGRTAYPFGHA